MTVDGGQKSRCQIAVVQLFCRSQMLIREYCFGEISAEADGLQHVAHLSLLYRQVSAEHIRRRHLAALITTTRNNA